MTRPLGPPPAALLLDVDGVLVDSAASEQRAWMWWCGLHGIDPAPLLAAHGMSGAAKVATYGTPDLDPIEEATRVTDFEVADTHDVTAYDGAAELLTSPYRVAIVSSAASRLVAARLTAAGLVVPRAVVAAESVTRGKPYAEPYLRGAELLGVDPQDCIAIEDAPAGVRSARAAGAYVVGVTTSVPREHLSEADEVVQALAPYARYLLDWWRAVHGPAS